VCLPIILVDKTNGLCNETKLQVNYLVKSVI